MKKLLLGFLVLGTVSAFANEQSKCEKLATEQLLQTDQVKLQLVDLLAESDLDNVKIVRDSAKSLAALACKKVEAKCDTNESEKLAIKQVIENATQLQQVYRQMMGKDTLVEIKNIRSGAGSSNNVAKVMLAYDQVVSNTDNGDQDGTTEVIMSYEFKAGQCQRPIGNGRSVSPF